MPELPEVETVVRSLRPHLEGRVVTHVGPVRPPTLARDSLPLSEAVGRRVVRVWRRGKLAMMDLAAPGREQLVLATHLRMTGALLAMEGAFPDVGSVDALAVKHTRVVLGLSAGGAFPCAVTLRFDDARTFGRMLLTNAAGLGSWPFWRDLGPEPLEVSEAEFIARLRGRRAIKAVLLDQRVVAGVGNIYADESLFMAGIAPRRLANTLASDEGAALLRALRAVLSLAIEQCGSSIRDYRDADGRTGAFQNSFAVYGRAGEPCRRCGATLARDRVAGRGTVFCPRCQR